MKRKSVIAAVVVLLALPPLWVAVDALAFHAENRNNGSIVTSGKKREYLLYVPRGYDRSRPAPLVISFHGAGGWPAQQRSLTAWNHLAESERFIVAYPEGSGVPSIWHDAEEGRSRDVKYVADLIDKLESEYNIDRRRIYANGFSNGGNMAFVVSCTLSGRIAAVGMAGAALLLPWSQCIDATPVPMIAFHGTADRFAPYDGGQSPIAPAGVRFQNVPMWASRWARRNGCGASAIESTAAERSIASTVIRREYTNCREGADVVLYTVRGGGHQWFGGKPIPDWFVGPRSNSVDATRQMWTFFREHPRRGAR